MKTKLLKIIHILFFSVVLAGLGYTQSWTWDTSFSTNGINGLVTGLAVYGGNVYAGGTFNNAGGVGANNIARWDGSSWSPLGSGVNNHVREIVVNGHDVYVGGNFTTAGGNPANHIAKWNILTNSWSTLNGGVDGKVYAIAVSNFKVYVGGDFQHAGGSTVVNNIAVYDILTGTWSALGDGITFAGTICDDYEILTGWSDAIVYDILMKADGVFVGGKFNKAGSVDDANNIALWNGSIWKSRGSGIQPYYIWQFVLSLATNWTNIFAGTSAIFEGMDGLYGDLFFAEVFKWSSGKDWSSIGDAYYFDSDGWDIGWPNIHALDYDGTSSILFAGGDFTPYPFTYVEGGISYPDLKSNFIAQWDGSNWSPLTDGGTNGRVYEIVAKPNEVWIGGNFTKTGDDVTSKNIGHYYITNPYASDEELLVPSEYSSIQIAIDAATDGDVIIVDPGTYIISSTIENNRVNNLEIIGNGCGYETCVYDASTASIISPTTNDYPCFSIKNVSGCIINGFEMKNSQAGVFFDNCTDCICKNNYIHNQDVVTVPALSICRSYEIDVHNCILDNNSFDGIGLWRSENVNINHNTIVNSDSRGCNVNQSHNIVLKNNILAHNLNYGIGMNTSYAYSFTEEYNCFYNNSSGDIQNSSTISTTSISSDPMFIDLNNQNYCLSSSSPCLGAGESGSDIGAMGESGLLEVADTASQTVPEFCLYQNYPNPFNAFTQISYSISTSSQVRLTIYNLRGEKIAALFNGQQESGKHTVTWNARYANGHPVSSGIYFYRLRTDTYVNTRKLLLMK